MLPSAPESPPRETGPIAEALEVGMAHHRAGRLRQAEEVYRAVLRAEPAHADALHLLGLAAYQAGRHDEAVASIRQALALQPDFPTAHDNLGVVLAERGRFDEAVACYREAQRLAPDLAGPHYHLGLAYEARGLLDEALASLRRALALDPGSAEAHCAMGNVQQKKGALDDAVASYRESLRLRPASAKTHNDLGYTLQRQGKYAEAVDHYHQALRLAPNYLLLYANLGYALVEHGKPEEAVEVCRRALRLRPDAAEVHNSLGIALNALGRWPEAVASYREALRLKPDYADACNNLGAVFQAQEKYAEAETCYREALRLGPGSAMACNNLANVLKSQGKSEEAMARFRQAIGLNPNYAAAHADFARVLVGEGKMAEAEGHYREALRLRPNTMLRMEFATMLPPLYQSLDELRAWRQRLTDNLRDLHREGVTADITRVTPEMLFYLAYQGLNDREIQRDVARLYTVAPVAPERPPAPRGPGDKIRVGFVSYHLRNHTIGRLMRGLIAQLDRAAFAVSVFSVGDHRDPIVQFIKEHCDAHHLLPGDVRAARQFLASQGLDVVFYPDIGMDPVSYALAFSRLAPVQCVTWGHPLTTGIDTVDYFISAEDLEAEGAEDHYTEKLVRLKTLPIYYYRPELVPPSRGRPAFGLGEDEHVYACPQTLFKFHPDFDDLLGRILRADPRGTLVLLGLPDGEWERQLLRRFTATIPDVVGRVRFIPKLTPEAFLYLNAAADVLLDPVHFGGGNTSYEGLAVGTPIVTLPSGFLRGRITYTLYRQMGLTDCVASSPDHYVELAVRLGTDPAYRAEVRAKILAANGALYENPAGVRELEGFLRQAVAEAPPAGQG